MRKALGKEVALIPGSGGIFDVIVDGKVVFSKAKNGRFPEPEHVIKILKK